MPSASTTRPQLAFGIGRVGINTQAPGGRVLAQQETQGAGDRGVGEARQRLRHFDDAPDAADVGERDQQRRLALGEAQRAHQFGLVVVAPPRESRDKAIERLLRRRAKKAREPRGIFGDQAPQIRRVIGEAEHEIARRRLRNRNSASAAPRPPASGRRGGAAPSPALRQTRRRDDDDPPERSLIAAARAAATA